MHDGIGTCGQLGGGRTEGHNTAIASMVHVHQGRERILMCLRYVNSGLVDGGRKKYWPVQAAFEDIYNMNYWYNLFRLDLVFKGKN